MNKKNLLIIDDEKDLCDVIKSKFEGVGFNVILEYNGGAGFQQVQKAKPDCILLDIRMPDEDGLTFLRRLRSYRDNDPEQEKMIRQTPVIVLTAAGKGMRSLFEVEGISDFVEKPFDTAELVDRVTRAIQKRAK